MDNLGCWYERNRSGECFLSLIIHDATLLIEYVSPWERMVHSDSVD